MKANTSQKRFLNMTQYALLVVFICYIPHFFTVPWWISCLVIATIGYKLIADYFYYPLPPAWVRNGLVIVILVLLKFYYGRFLASGFFISFLLLFIGLKCIEIQRSRDLKLIILCNFYIILAALILIQELWIIIYLLAALLANLSLMLKVIAPTNTLKQTGFQSLKILLMALPVSLLLFFIFPRFNPLWQVPALGQAKLGFSEKMSPGSITELFANDEIALRITFNHKPILNGYWRGLVLNYYNGISWLPDWQPTQFVALPLLKADEKADYDIMLEAHQSKWLFYLGYPTAARPGLAFSTHYGLISQNKEIINQRFAYSIRSQNAAYYPLSDREIRQSIQLPKGSNPRLTSWAIEQFANAGQNPQLFIQYLGHYIRTQNFWYTLSPPELGSQNQMDIFWFNTQKGYCEYYASAVAIILRAAGIPARVVVGYQGGKWNPIAGYLTIQQNDAHAWVEYWQQNIGWQEFDPTSFIAPNRIDETIRDYRASRLGQGDYDTTSTLSWRQQGWLFLESVRYFTERWLLFYNQETQLNLLKNLKLSQWQTRQLLQITVVIFILFLAAMGLFYQWRQRQQINPLLLEYQLLQKELRRFNIPIAQASTLKKQCQLLIKIAPELTPIIHSFLNRYENLRLKHTQYYTKQNQKKTLQLFKKFREKIRKYRKNNRQIK